MSVTTVYFYTDIHKKNLENYYFEDNYVKVKGHGHLVLGKERLHISTHCIGILVLISLMATFTNRTINRSSFLFCSGHKAKIYCLVVKFPETEIFRLLVTKL